MRGFSLIVTSVLLVFLGVMVAATYMAFTHRSGNTRIDMGKAHLLRLHRVEK